MNSTPEKTGLGPVRDSEELSLVDIANPLLRRWRLVVTLPLLFAFIALAWALVQERTYSATASFVPQAAEGASGGTAAALAQQFGVNLGGDRSGQSPEFYANLLRSRTVLRQAVGSDYEVTTDGGGVRSGNLIELYDVAPEGESKAWQEAVERLRENLSTSVARETGVVQVQVSDSRPDLAEQIATRLLEILEDFNTSARQKRALEEGRFISSRLDEAQEDLRAAETALQRFLSQNRQFENSPELVFEHERLHRQVLMRQEVYTSLLRSREQARIDAMRDTPLFTVIDHPVGTAEPESRYTVLRTFLGFMLGLVIAMIIAITSEMLTRSRRSDDPRYRELRDLSRQAADDIRHPRRWLGGTKNGGISGT